jgi:hypothetical protein
MSRRAPVARRTSALAMMWSKCAWVLTMAQGVQDLLCVPAGIDD